jgi:hypothetical protein
LDFVIVGERVRTAQKQNRAAHARALYKRPAIHGSTRAGIFEPQKRTITFSSIASALLQEDLLVISDNAAPTE